MLNQINRNICLLLLLMCLSTSTSCNKECNESLCDLITNLVENGITLLAGGSVDITSVVNNVIDTGTDCLAGTLSAGASESNMLVEYGTDGQNFANVVSDGNFPVQPIPAGMVAEGKYNTTFSEPGFYRVITFTDDTRVVDERDENNNGSPTALSQVGLNASGQKTALIVHVLPNPEFTRKSGDPFMKINSYSCRIIDSSEVKGNQSY